MTQLLEDILSMSLSYLGSEHRPHSHDWIMSDEKDYAGLFDSVFSLLEQKLSFAQRGTTYRLMYEIASSVPKAMTNPFEGRLT